MSDHAAATRQIHSGYTPGVPQNTVTTPIYQSAAYRLASFAEARDLFALSKPGNIYSRNGNPTNAVLERRVAELEGGIGAVAVGSGQAAVATALLTLIAAAGPGEPGSPNFARHHIVASNKLYGGTSDLLGDTLADFGVEVTLVDPLDHGSWEEAIRPTTRAVFLESLGNPIVTVPDLPKIAQIAHAASVPVVVDNTMATPALFRPIEHGADYVVHSATKGLGGHGTAIAGVVVDAGTFDFTADPARWRKVTRPYRRYADLVFTDAFDGADGRTPFLVLARAKTVHDFGPSLSPVNAAQILTGIETLQLRVQRQSESALALAQFLNECPQVARVHHPGLPEHAHHNIAQRLFPQGVGGVFSFDLAGGEASAEAFIDALELFSLAANIGDARSLVVHPATMTHARLDAEERADAGISLSTIRLSVGLEDVRDLAADVRQALAASHQHP